MASQTSNPLRIPIFYTLTKIHKPIPVDRPMISGCDGFSEKNISLLGETTPAYRKTVSTLLLNSRLKYQRTKSLSSIQQCLKVNDSQNIPSWTLIPIDVCYARGHHLNTLQRPRPSPLLTPL